MLLYAPDWLFLLPGSLLLAVGLFLVFWLVRGPQNLTPGIQLDIHTMIFGVLFTLLGAQIVSVGFCAKVFSYAERFDRNPVSLKRALRHVKLEHGLLLGAALALVGFVGDTRIFWDWVSEGFGRLHDEREVLFWSLWFVLGVQTCFRRSCSACWGLAAIHTLAIMSGGATSRFCRAA